MLHTCIFMDDPLGPGSIPPFKGLFRGSYTLTWHGFLLRTLAWAGMLLLSIIYPLSALYLLKAQLCRIPAEAIKNCSLSKLNTWYSHSL